LASRFSQAVCQGHPVGRCRVTRRAEDEIRAGTVMTLRRIVAVVALARAGPVMVAAARVRLNAMTARTSQAAFAVNFAEVIWSRPDGVHDVHEEGAALSGVRRRCDGSVALTHRTVEVRVA